uniref:Protein kinase domain-containing protein n=2 Tax=Meloidogyne TaxID=189290 RepID=A0A915N2H0_MELJA
MFGHGEKHGNYFIALELGGKDLKKYYYERDPQDGKRVARSNEAVLTKIVKGAARALAQFHKYGVHRDIKHQNFVVSRDQDSNAEVVDVKLIDFNSSYLYEQNERDFVENSKRNDITNFGAMVYRLFNEHYIITGGLLATYDDIPKLSEYSNYDHSSKLDRVIKACFQEKSIQPIMEEIVDFLNEDIIEFEYETKLSYQIEHAQQHYKTQRVEHGHSVHRDNSPPSHHGHINTPNRDESPPPRPRKFFCFWC